MFRERKSVRERAREGGQARERARERAREIPVRPTLYTLWGACCRGTSLIRNSAPLGPYRRTMPRTLWKPYGGELIFMSEVPLYTLDPALRRGRKRKSSFWIPFHRGASIIRNRYPVGPYIVPCLGSYGGIRRGARFLMGEVSFQCFAYRATGNVLSVYPGVT